MPRPRLTACLSDGLTRPLTLVSAPAGYSKTTLLSKWRAAEAGRVFSARRLIAWFTNPISPIIGGTLADFVLEPAMRSDSVLASIFGGLVGTGPGAGMGLLMVFSGNRGDGEGENKKAN